MGMLCRLWLHCIDGNHLVDDLKYGNLFGSSLPPMQYHNQYLVGPLLLSKQSPVSGVKVEGRKLLSC